VLTITNYDGANTTASLDAIFRNCIFWGDEGIVDDEVIVDKKGSTPFTVNFDYNLWRVQTTPANVVTTQIINNQNPQFDSIDASRRYYNFHLQPTSPAVNKGTNASVTIDLDGKPRPVGLPDLGCFER
jgi:hypothetical protein